MALPPLTDPSSKLSLSDPTEKQALLARELLHMESTANDIPISFSNLYTQTTQLTFTPITIQETEVALLKTKNSAPGSDGISLAAITLAWPKIKDVTHSLFRRSLEVGWHPRPFRNATICILGKPGKRDRHSPHSYCPIALIATLGKGLEYIITKCISWLAITQKILHNQQFRALPLRSATDLVMAAVHDIEEA